MSYFEKVSDIYEKINTGRLMEAFEQYYDDNIKMIEANGEVREGKDVNRQFETQFLGSIDQFHGAGVNNITANENEATTMVESWMEVTFKGAPGPIKMEQIARQKWQGDKVVEERFYYNPKAMESAFEK